LISFAIKKILKNKLMYLGLILSMIILITVSCLIPMFYSALLGRMLLMNFSDKTVRDDKFSNSSVYQVYFSQWNQELVEQQDYYSDRIENHLVPQLMQPVAYSDKIYTSKTMTLQELTGHEADSMQMRSFRAFCFRNIENSYQLIKGKWPSSEVDSEGIYDAVISNDTAQVYGMIYGRTYEVTNDFDNPDLLALKFRITGIVHPITGGISSIENQMLYEQGILLDETVFHKLFIEDRKHLNTIKWNFMLDYTKADMNDYEQIAAAKAAQTLEFSELAAYSSLNFFRYDGIDVFSAYFPQRLSLIRLILVLTLPMLLLLIFAIFFISKLIIDGDKNEISVMQSRGATTLQITQIYLIQSVFLVFLPLLISPFLAVAVCKLMGDTSGFLEFADNIALATAISAPVILVGILSSLIAVITIVLPAVIASRTNIVFRKQKESEKNAKPFWQRFYLDFILMAISAYGYFTYTQRQRIISEQLLSGDSIPVEPLSFAVIILFILSAGMIFMRLFPAFIKLLTKAFNKKWPASFYTALQRVIQLQSREQFIVLLLILTFSFGVFSANSARTINKNTDNSILYLGGADMIIHLIPTNALSPNELEGKPSRLHFADIEGIEEVSIVSMAGNVQVYRNLKHNALPIQMTGVDVVHFAKVVREGGFMKDRHINHYLNLLAEDLHHAIISKSLADEMGYRIGDPIQVNPNGKGRSYGSEGMDLKVAAIVDSWPAYPYSIDETGSVVQNHLIVVNSEVLEDEYLDVTYRLWVRKTSEATISSIRTQLRSKYIGVYGIKDFMSDVIYSRNSAQRQSLNSLLTLNFIVIFFICLAGFLMYWILSIKSRVIQFGFFRAIGMSAKSVYLMLIYEQFFLTLSSVVFSVLLGGFASRAFMDILKMTFSAKEQLMPFTFMSSSDDFLKIYLILAFMVAVTYTAITFQIKRLNIGRTIKLGEE
jgi:putative ABC transport system permease protein